jgi:hypothetical protein
MRIISAITEILSLYYYSTNHLFVNGMIVRVDIPPGFGMQQINQSLEQL